MPSVAMAKHRYRPRRLRLWLASTPASLTTRMTSTNKTISPMSVTRRSVRTDDGTAASAGSTAVEMGTGPEPDAFIFQHLRKPINSGVGEPALGGEQTRWTPLKHENDQHQHRDLAV